jgi:lysophospholipase L1-like esterase
MFPLAKSSIPRDISFALAHLILAVGLVACLPSKRPRSQEVTGESVILIGEEPAHLARLPAASAPVRLRNRYLPDPSAEAFVEGRDFVFDASSGTIRRTPGSRIPDFRTNSLHGKEDFDHSKFPGFGNTGFFVFVDYQHPPESTWPVQRSQADLLPRAVAKLAKGGPFRIVAYGDSITAGGDATRPEWIFWNRWAEGLRNRHPGSEVTILNGATGGDSTVQGLQRLQAKVLDQKPDLVLIGFGMNDHNRGGVPIPQFEENLREMIRRIRESNGAEVMLFSAFPPNPKWKFGSHRMEEYAAATARVAQETRAAYADVHGNWLTWSARKKPEDLLGNNINHPNDFGHWLYFRVLEACGL